MAKTLIKAHSDKAGTSLSVEGGSNTTNAADLTDERLLRGAGGNGVQESGITVDDSNNISGVGTLDTSGNVTVTGDVEVITGDLIVDTNTLVTSGGNVGIGTASPNVKLSVHTDGIGSLSNFKVSAGTSGSSERGIGLTTLPDPAIILDANEGEGIGGGLDYSTIVQEVASGNLITNNRAGDIVFQTSTNERLRIDASANTVNLGSSTRLQVSGRLSTEMSFAKYQLSANQTISGTSNQKINYETTSFSKGSNFTMGSGGAVGEVTVNAACDVYLYWQIRWSVDTGNETARVWVDRGSGYVTEHVYSFDATNPSTLFWRSPATVIQGLNSGDKFYVSHNETNGSTVDALAVDHTYMYLEVKPTIVIY